MPTARTRSIVAGVTMALTVVSARAWMEQLVDPLSIVQLSLLPTKHVLPLAGTSPTVRYVSAMGTAAVTRVRLPAFNVRTTPLVPSVSTVLTDIGELPPMEPIVQLAAATSRQ